MPLLGHLKRLTDALGIAMIPENLHPLFVTHITFLGVIINNVIVISILQEQPIWGIGVCCAVGMGLSWACIVAWDKSYPIRGHVVSFSDVILVYMLSLSLSISMYTLSSENNAPAPIVFTTTGLIGICISILCVWRASYQPNCKHRKIEPARYKPKRTSSHHPNSDDHDPTTITFDGDHDTDLIAS
jgi:hypothetical protein